MSISKISERILDIYTQTSNLFWKYLTNFLLLFTFRIGWKKAWLNYSNIIRRFTKNNYQTSDGCWIIPLPIHMEELEKVFLGLGRGMLNLGLVVESGCSQPSPLNIPQFPRWSFAAHTHRSSSCRQGSFEMFSQGLNDGITTRRRRWE